MSRGMTSWFLAIICSILFWGFASPALVAESQQADQLDKMVVASLRQLFELVSGNPWTQSIIVILITLTSASLLTWVIFSIILMITRRTSFLFDDQIALLLRPPIFYTLVVIGLSAGIDLMLLEDRCCLWL